MKSGCRWFSFPAVALLLIVTQTCTGRDAPAAAPLPAPAPSPPMQAQSAAQPLKLALLVGVNRYKFGLNRLQGCVNDVAEMKQALMADPYKFPAENIKTLVDEEATRAAIIAGIRDHLIARATPGAVVVFHFSGHGSTLDNPRDPSGKDNTIVPHDSRDPAGRVTDIRDKELNVLLRQLAAKTKNVTFILDSCFSGTGTRGAGEVRAAPPDTRFGGAPPAAETFGSAAGSRDAGSPSGFSDRDISYVLVAAARSDQEARETAVGPRVMGALTRYFVREILLPSPAPRSYRDVMTGVIGAVRGEYPTQTPQLEGQGVDRVVFGTEMLPHHAYIDARPKAGREVQLDAGEVHGLTAGSLFDVYGPDAHRFAPPEKRLAAVQLTAVGAVQSTGVTTSGGPVPQGARAIERLHNHEAAKTVIEYDGLGSSKSLQVIKNALDARKDKPTRAAAAGEAFQIRLQESGGRVGFFGPDGRALGSPLDASDTELSRKAEARVMGWVRWFGVLRLHNSAAGAAVKFELVPSGRQVASAPGEVPTFTPGGSRFTLRVTNRGPEKVFIYILDLPSTGEVMQVYPDRGSTAVLDPGQTSTIPGWNAGIGDPSATSVQDVFKLIAANSQVDLSILEQEAVRGGRNAPADPLSSLLFEAATGTRHGSRTVPTGWATAEVAFQVCRNVDVRGRCR